MESKNKVTYVVKDLNWQNVDDKSEEWNYIKMTARDYVEGTKLEIILTEPKSSRK